MLITKAVQGQGFVIDSLKTFRYVTRISHHADIFAVRKQMKQTAPSMSFADHSGLVGESFKPPSCGSMYQSMHGPIRLSRVHGLKTLTVAAFDEDLFLQDFVESTGTGCENLRILLKNIHQHSAARSGQAAAEMYFVHVCLAVSASLELAGRRCQISIVVLLTYRVLQ
jgi:hypothetical protein